MAGWGLWSGICVVFGFVHKYSRGNGCLHNITFCFLDCRGVGRFRRRCFSHRVDFQGTIYQPAPGAGTRGLFFGWVMGGKRAVYCTVLY